jgi:hypothetical protein
MTVLPLISSNSSPAYALEAEAIRSGPGLQFVEIGHTIAGSKLHLVQPDKTSGTPEEPWSQVRFARDGIGWVRTASLLPL